MASSGSANDPGRDHATLDQAIDGCEIVYNFAASDLDEALDKPLETACAR